MLKKPPLIIDTSVLGNLLAAQKVELLKMLYTGRLIIPDEVIAEATQYPPLYKQLIGICGQAWYRTYSITNIEDLRLYGSLVRRFRGGCGEAAVITIAKIEKGTVCSDNLRDIKPYIDKNSIPLMTTTSVIYDAYLKRFISEIEGEQIIQLIRTAGNKLPMTNFQQVIEWFANGKGKPIY